jgi:hypothetical protein
VVYLRHVDARGMDWQNRAHFFAVCRWMRRILIDFARSRLYKNAERCSSLALGRSPGQRAKAAYQGFLTLWKDGDTEIPILKQAAEYSRFNSSVLSPRGRSHITSSRVLSLKVAT